MPTDSRLWRTHSCALSSVLSSGLLVIATGISADGRREVLGFDVAAQPDRFTELGRMIHEQASHLSCLTRRDATRRANLGTYQA